MANLEQIRREIEQYIVDNGVVWEECDVLCEEVAGDICVHFRMKFEGEAMGIGTQIRLDYLEENIEFAKLGFLEVWRSWHMPHLVPAEKMAEYLSMRQQSRL